MRKKKKEIAPPPVETDFYTEALKAFEVVLPPSQEELEAQRRAEEEKTRKRARRLRTAMVALVALGAVALVLWGPWDGIVDDPVIQEPVVNIPVPDSTKIGFHVYAVPGLTDPASAAYTGAWDFYGGQAEDLVKQLEQLNWFPTALMSSIPTPAIGNITILRDGQEHTVGFNAYGTLFAGGYMANPDGAVWDDIFDLLLRMNTVTQTGRFSVDLIDGSTLELNILIDGSFAAIRDKSIIYHGYWARVGEYLLLYTDDPKVGLGTLKVGDGVMRYQDKNNSWLLQELKGGGFLYHESVIRQTGATMTVHMSWPGASVSNVGTASLSQEQYQRFLGLLRNAQWIDMGQLAYMPETCGSMGVSRKTGSDLTTTVSIRFDQKGNLYDGLRYCQLSDEDWMAFVKLLGLAGSQELAYRSFTQDMQTNSILLQFTMDGRFEYRDEDEAAIGNYLLIGDLVLLAGPGGLRELLFWDRENGNLTTQTGEVLKQIPILYG